MKRQPCHVLDSQALIWCRFSIRGLLIATAIIAGGLGWYVSRVAPQRRAVKSVLAAGGWVAYGTFEIPSDALQDIVRVGNHVALHDFIWDVTVVSVAQHDAKSSDRLCAELRSLTNLRQLYMERAEFTDVGLSELAALSQLGGLFATDAHVTDLGLRHFSTLPHLECLDLSGSDVGDEGMKELARVRTLRYLRLEGTNVTNNGIERLRRALPRCSISR